MNFAESEFNAAVAGVEDFGQQVKANELWCAAIFVCYAMRAWHWALALSEPV